MVVVVVVGVVVVGVGMVGIITRFWLFASKKFFWATSSLKKVTSRLLYSLPDLLSASALASVASLGLVSWRRLKI